MSRKAEQLKRSPIWSEPVSRSRRCGATVERYHRQNRRFVIFRRSSRNDQYPQLRCPRARIAPARPFRRSARSDPPGAADCGDLLRAQSQKDRSRADRPWNVLQVQRGVRSSGSGLPQGNRHSAPYRKRRRSLDGHALSHYGWFTARTRPRRPRMPSHWQACSTRSNLHMSPNEFTARHWRCGGGCTDPATSKWPQRSTILPHCAAISATTQRRAGCLRKLTT